jgi:acyl carrier protein
VHPPQIAIRIKCGSFTKSADDLPAQMINGGDVGPVLKAIYRTIGELNDQLPAQKRLRASPETVLMGEKGHLDSLGLITLLVSLEDELEVTLGRRVKVFDEALLADPNGPMATVGALADHISASL